MLLIILLVGSAVVSANEIYYAEENAEQLFEEFIQTYNKEYTPEEKVKRLDIFKESLKEINRLNALNGAVFGINKFTDLTDEEMRRYMGYEPLIGRSGAVSNCMIVTDDDVTTTDAPEALDYRQENAVTPVKSQLPCGSCWIFASIGSIEGSYALKHGKLLSFSEQQLLDCLKCSAGCDEGGKMVDAMSELVTSDGIMLEEDYPYIMGDQQCKFDQAREVVKVIGCYNYQLHDENKLKEVLYKNGPITVGVNAAKFNKYHHGVFTGEACRSSVIAGHAVLLVGYGREDGKDYWLIKNSWGESFGEDGYIKLSRGENTCDILSPSACSAIVA